jgi:hypothetical protein
MTMTGKVVALFPERGFFLLADATGTLYFAHVRDLAGGQAELDQLVRGDVCTFTPTERPGRRDLAARSIVYVKSAAVARHEAAG